MRSAAGDCSSRGWRGLFCSGDDDDDDNDVDDDDDDDDDYIDHDHETP